MTQPDPSMPANLNRTGEIDVDHVLKRWNDIEDRGHPLGLKESDL